MDQMNQKLEANFSTLVLSIASSAIMNLGLEKNPQTKTVDKNLPLAQFSIDLLILLKQKTKGNLSETEAHNLDAIIQDLQMKYIGAR